MTAGTAPCQTSRGTLFEPMVAQAEPDAIELGIVDAQVGVGEMRPVATEVEGLPIPNDYLNSSSAPGGQVHARSVAGWHVCCGKYASSSHFDVRYYGTCVVTGVPSEDNGFKACAFHFLIFRGGK